MFQYSVNREVGKENQQVQEKGENICKAVKRNKRNASKYDYPAVVVGCYKSEILYITTTRDRPSYKDVPALEQALLRIGKIGTKRSGCKNTIGACAEPKAAFITMKKQKCTLKQLKFTIAFRPRTSQKIDYCTNCKNVFGL